MASEQPPAPGLTEVPDDNRPVVIRLDRVTKRFPGSASDAVTSLSLDLREGEITAFVGPSGCGKTTTLTMINRLVEPTSGRIEIFGEGHPYARLTTGTPQGVKRVTGDALREFHQTHYRPDGAVLTDPGGRRQLALMVDMARLDAVRPGLEDQHDLPLHRLLARLDLAEVPSAGAEHRDVDTWADLRDLRSPAP